jgi:hypothetical protein
MAGITARALPVPSAGFVASAVLKTGPGRLTYLQLYNNNASTRYVMLFDATALPANGTNPLVMQGVGATQSIAKELAFPPEGLIFNSGLVIALSSTPGSLTIAGADMSFTAGIS